MLPHFLIVGAMKAGTTTLRHYLQGVEQVWIYPGEVRFFSQDRKYAQGLGWYESLFEQAAGKAVIGEKSPAYSFQPRVPQRIHSCLPDVKLIWLFREPVARTYSHYWHSAIRGKERLSFQTAVAREDERVRHNLLRGYKRRSRYAEQVSRYLQFFPKEQMLFLLFEELVKEPAAVLNRVLEFLEVDGRIDRLPHHTHANVTRAPRSVRLQWLARTIFDRGPGFDLVKQFNVRKEPGYPRIPQDLREELSREFEEPNEQLAALTGLNLSVWRK
jgi:hypothetical protein